MFTPTWFDLTYLQPASILEGTFYIRNNSSVTVMLSIKFGLSWSLLNYAVRYQCRSSRRLLWLAQWIYKNKTKKSPPSRWNLYRIYVKLCPSLVIFTTYLQDSVSSRNCSPWLFAFSSHPSVPLSPGLELVQFFAGFLSLLRFNRIHPENVFRAA